MGIEEAELTSSLHRAPTPRFRIVPKNIRRKQSMSTGEVSAAVTSSSLGTCHPRCKWVSCRILISFRTLFMFVELCVQSIIHYSHVVLQLRYEYMPLSLKF